MEYQPNRLKGLAYELKVGRPPGFVVVSRSASPVFFLSRILIQGFVTASP
jgi:hypothetical protein